MGPEIESRAWVISLIRKCQRESWVDCIPFQESDHQEQQRLQSRPSSIVDFSLIFAMLILQWSQAKPIQYDFNEQANQLSQDIIKIKDGTWTKQS